MSIWAAIKKLVNDNFDYPLNKQKYIPFVGAHAQYFFADSTFVVPETGWYIITCVGKGGTGGGSADKLTSVVKMGGGGGGAVTQGKYFLNKDDEYAITIGSSSAFGNLISAGAGGDGSSGVGGSGGECIIPGNIFAYKGKDGEATSTTTHNKGGDAGLCHDFSCPLKHAGRGYMPWYNITKTSGEGSSSSTSGSDGTLGGGSGGGAYSNGNTWYGVGGNGGAAYGGGGASAYATRISSSYIMYGYGGKGGSGMIIVEHGITLLG